MKSEKQKTTDLIKQIIRNKNPKAEIILFGSHARGNWHSDSDWDVLILLNESNVDRKTEREYQDELFELELQIGQPITVYVFPKKEWESKYAVTPLYQSIKREGIIL
jgi:predicted nucleotidyltransferase